MQAQYKRKLSTGSEYERYFKKQDLKRTDPILNQNGSVFSTISLMEKIVKETLADTQEIAQVLKGATLDQTCRNIYDFLYRHVQYTLDKEGVEQLRRPLRTWADRKAGVDCDCYSIFISSVLWNLGIPHYFRMTKYGGDYQHIYVVVPQKPGANMNQTKNYYTIDPVVDRYNEEVKYSGKHDKLMSPIQFLNGTPALGNTSVALGFGAEFIGFGQKGVSGLGSVATPEALYFDFLNRTKLHLQNTLAELKANPKAAPGRFKQQIEYMLANWDNAELRSKALDQLEAEEYAMGLSGLGNLGGLWSSIKKGVKQAAGWVADKVTDAAQAVGTGIKNAAEWTADKVSDGAKAAWEGVTNAAEWVGTGVKNAAEWTADKAGDAWDGIKNAAEWTFEKIVQLNPLSILMRNGLLLAFKVNLFRMSERLGYGYWTEQEAQQKGLNLNEWRKLKGKLDDVHKLWRGLQGDEDSLKKNILQGWEHGVEKRNLISGFGSLGAEPATTTATAAAMPLILKIVAMLSSVVMPLLLKNANAPKPDNLDYSADGSININTPFPESEAAYYANPGAFTPQTGNSNNDILFLGGGILLLIIALRGKNKQQ